MLICLSGRKKSGKTTIAKILLKKNFQKASFAAPLKEYLSEIYNWKIEELNDQDSKEAILEKPALWNKEICLKLERITNSPNLPYEGEKEFKTRREALQFIGTEIFRKYDINFHVKKFREKYKDGDYVCDDVRFPNELEVSKEMNAKCLFIIRPYNFNFSNHSSEISLRRKDFDNVLVNDTTIGVMIRKATNFFSNKKNVSKEQILERMKSGEKINNYLLEKYLIWTGEDLNHDAFYEKTKESCYWAEKLLGRISNKIKLSDTKEEVKKFAEFVNYKGGNDSYFISFSSPFIMEDLKTYVV